MSTEERLEKLESELTIAKSRYRRLLFLIGGLMAGASALAWTESGSGSGIRQEVVRAERFVLEDGGGTMRGVLGIIENGTALVLSDESGTARIGLAVASGDDRTQVELLDRTGQQRAALAVAQNEVALELTDDAGQTRAIMGGGSSRTSDGQQITYPESSLRLADPDGNLIWTAPR